MDVAQLFQSLSTNTAWQFLVGIGVLVFGTKAILSEKTVKEKLWLIGWLSRKWSERQEQAADLEEDLAKRRTKDLWEEIERVDRARQADKLEFQRQIKRLEVTTQHQHEYIVWVTDIMRRIEVWATKLGETLPEPKFLTFHEWKESHRIEES